MKCNGLSCLRPPVCALVVFAMVVLGLAARAFAQDTPQQPSPAPPARPPVDQLPSAPTPSNPVALYNFLQNKSIIFPDIASSAERLSIGQKFQLFVDNAVSVHTFTYAIMGSGIGQAENSPTGFGEGGDAYAKRFGSSMARQASSEFFGTFIIASVLHDDPRFFPEAHPSFFGAVKYSCKHVFIIRSDDGRDVIAWPRLGGPLLAEGLANVYWPDRNRTVGDTFLRYGIDLTAKAGGNMLRDYFPVFYGKIHHRQPAPAHE